MRRNKASSGSLSLISSLFCPRVLSPSVLLKFHTHSVVQQKRLKWEENQIFSIISIYFFIFMYFYHSYQQFLFLFFHFVSLFACVIFFSFARARFVRISQDHPPGTMDNHIAPHISLECQQHFIVPAGWCCTTGPSLMVFPEELRDTLFSIRCVLNRTRLITQVIVLNPIPCLLTIATEIHLHKL